MKFKFKVPMSNKVFFTIWFSIFFALWIPYMSNFQLDSNKFSNSSISWEITEESSPTPEKFGRSKRGFESIVYPFTNPLQQFRMKEWQYFSIDTNEFFVAFLVVQIGYASNAACYAVLKNEPNPVLYEFSDLTPLGLSVDFKNAPSSNRGYASFQKGDDRIKITSVYPDGWEAEVNVREPSGKLLSGEFKITFNENIDESLALFFPLAKGKRPAYTHKINALPASGVFRFDNSIYDFSEGLASMDWTRSMADYQTTWNWLSLSTWVNKTRIGVNLSSKVYDIPEKGSMENGLWINNKVYTLGEAHFSIPSDPKTQQWTISTTEERGISVSFVFTPVGTKEEHLHLLVIDTDFVQVCGWFRGQVNVNGETYSIENGFGVVEDHFARW